MQKSRHIEMTYAVTVPELDSPSESLNIWIPFPRSTPHQELRTIDVQTSLPYSVRYDSVYGNAILHVTSRTASLPYEISIHTKAVRHERSVNLRRFCDRPPEATSPFQVQRSESRLIRFTPEVLSIAEAIRQTHTGTVEIARAAYEHVLEHMTYDKSHEGWGSGSSEFACSIGKGNCTDFHSLFLAIIRACGVPGEFEIGVAFPETMTAGDITAYKCGYHCWTSFYAPGLGWVPVDCSEAAQKPGLRDYYFGAIDENRFLLSYGRDILLPGRTSAEPVNFFTEPVVDTDAGMSAYYTKSVSFRDA